MPAMSEKQRRYFGAALGRKRAGESSPDDPDMSDEKMADFARKPTRHAKRGKRTTRRSKR
jgi:hypothetical protein